MHPLLLFTLLFLPGIKSFNELQSLDQNDEHISITDITPIQEPQIDKSDIIRNYKNPGHLKPYERHIAAKFKNSKSFERGNDLKYSLVSRHYDSDEDSHDESRHYKPTPPYKYDTKEHKSKKSYQKDGKKENFNKQLMVYSKKHLDEKYRRDKHLKDSFKTIENYKQYKNKEYEHNYKKAEKAKHFNKGDKKENGKIEKHYAEHPVSKENKYKKAHYSEDKKYVKHSDRFERVKRQVDVSEESSESEPYEVESNESGDKHFIEHMMVNGYQHESDHPFKDIIEVDFKQKSDESGEKVPVNEDPIKKTVAYNSCNEGNGLLCRKTNKDESHHGSVEQPVHETNFEQQQNKEVNHGRSHNGEVDETWLKLFEESVLRDGIDVEYHPQ